MTEGKQQIKITDGRIVISFFAIISVVMFAFMFFKEALIDDGAFHLGRLQGLADDLSWGNLKPWIYSKTNYGTGYPLGIFYPDLFLYPFALLAKTGVGAYASYVIMMMSINFASVVTFYLCIKKILQGCEVENYKSMAFVMSLMYLIYPYRLWCLYARMAIGECMFFIFFPIIVLGIYEIFYKKKFSLWLFVGMTGMIYSHILSTAVCIVVLTLYYLINIRTLVKNPKIILHTAVNGIVTILCGLAVVLPILEMQNFTTLYYMTGEKTFGLLVDHTIRLINNDVVSIICTIVVIVVGGVVLFRGKLKTKLVTISVFVLFMCTDMFCWESIEQAMPFINTLQFPFRLLGLAAVPLSVFLGIVLYNHKPIYISSVIILLSGFMFLVMGIYIPIEGINIYGAVGHAEYVPVELREYMVENGTIPDVEGQYSIVKQGNKYSFQAEDGVVVLPISYYKGYEVFDENQTYEYSDDIGLMKIEGVKSNEVTVVYKGTMIQKLSLGISILSLINVAIYVMVIKKKEQKLYVTEDE